jgi:hypothetical protein
MSGEDNTVVLWISVTHFLVKLIEVVTWLVPGSPMSYGYHSLKHREPSSWSEDAS